MPVFALAYLHDALARAEGERDERAVDRAARGASRNAILPEGGTAHVEELSDPYLLWFWNSNVRSTAIVLNSRGGAERARSADPARPARHRGPPSADGALAHGRAKERALGQHAGERARDGGAGRLLPEDETECPTSAAVVELGRERARARGVRGRSTDGRRTRRADGRAAAQAAAPGNTRPLTFTREGHRHAVLHRAAALRGRPPVPGGPRPGLPHRAQLRAATSRRGSAAGVHELQGRRSGAGHAASSSCTKERRFVAVTDPLPAGFEAVESWFATTAADRWRAAGRAGRGRATSSGRRGGARGGFDHVERHDDRVLLFATRLSEGRAQVHLRRARHDRRHVPHGAGARRGDVRAGGIRPDGDGGDRDPVTARGGASSKVSRQSARVGVPNSDPL